MGECLWSVYVRPRSPIPSRRTAPIQMPAADDMGTLGDPKFCDYASLVIRATTETLSRLCR